MAIADQDSPIEDIYATIANQTYHSKSGSNLITSNGQTTIAKVEVT